MLYILFACFVFLTVFIEERVKMILRELEWIKSHIYDIEHKNDKKDFDL